MANNGIITPYDDAGFPANARQTAAVTLGGTQVVKAGPGRVNSVLVTTATASAATTIYDSASTNSGTPLLVIPASTAAGTVYNVSLPALNGITVYSPGATGNITVGYS